MRREKGFTLIELIVTTLVLTLLAGFGLSVGFNVLQSVRLDATVEEMRSLSHAAYVAKNLPGGGAYNNVNTSIMAGLLNSHDANFTNIPSTSDLKTFWGNNYKITTSGRFSRVSTTVPLQNINPFGTEAVPSGSNTVLHVWHRPSHNNGQHLNSSLANKRIMYQE